MKQITVIADDRPGIVAEICETLAAENINIETLDADSHDNKGIVILTVDKYDAALRALRNAAFQAVSEEAILIELEDKPGALAKIAKRFKDADINLNGLRIMRRNGNTSIVALTVKRSDEAVALVKDVMIN